MLFLPYLNNQIILVIAVRYFSILNSLIKAITHRYNNNVPSVKYYCIFHNQKIKEPNKQTIAVVRAIAQIAPL